MSNDIVLIAAVTRNGAIGKNNQLLVHIPEDLKRFKALTLGHPVIMGRKTFDSIGRPLPGRRNIVISRSSGRKVGDVEFALGLLDAISRVADAPKAFILGGEQIYSQAWSIATHLELTEIDADLEGDAFFPMTRRHFAEVARTPGKTADGLLYHFVTYVRVSEDSSLA